MALNAADKDLIQKRRERVARLRLQGLSIREIAFMLTQGQDPIMSKENNGVWNVGTIHSDLEAIKKDWQENAARDANEFISEELSKLTEIEKTAWSQKRLDIVLRAMERRAKLLGLDKPTKIEGAGDNGEIILKVVYADEKRE